MNGWAEDGDGRRNSNVHAFMPFDIILKQIHCRHETHTQNV